MRNSRRHHYVIFCLLILIDAVGSCSMLPRDKQGVVDPKLKVCNISELYNIYISPHISRNGIQVYGTTNLRVADLSIVPLHLATHTQCASCTLVWWSATDILNPYSHRLYDWRKGYVQKCKTCGCSLTSPFSASDIITGKYRVWLKETNVFEWLWNVGNW